MLHESPKTINFYSSKGLFLFTYKDVFNVFTRLTFNTKLNQITLALEILHVQLFDNNSN